MTPDDLDPNYIAHSRFLVATGITQAISPSARSTVLRAVQIAHSHGVEVAYDPNLRLRLWSAKEAREALEEVLPYVSIFMPSGPQEVRHLLGLEDAKEVIAYFWRAGVKVVALKWGAAGGWIGIQETGVIVHIPAHPVGEPKDTTGAGDVFDGVFLHGVCVGMSYEEAARLGMIAAALKVRGRGAIESLPSREEVYATYRASVRSK